MLSLKVAEFCFAFFLIFVFLGGGGEGGGGGAKKHITVFQFNC